jgi:zinc D-Ala-D-Ala carboxypeptidase
MKISKHLELSELIRSESAKRLGVSNMPTAEHIENLKVLAEKVFEPIREHFKAPIRISSGYRSPMLNKAVGGANTSQHSLGQAIDIDMDGTDIKNSDIFAFIKNNLDFDQLINEFDYSWIHVSYSKKNRKQILLASKINGKTVYKKA